LCSGVWSPGAIDLAGGLMLVRGDAVLRLRHAWSRRRAERTGLSAVTLVCGPACGKVVLLAPFG